MLHNRIKSKSGATILIALLFFMLCAMAGSVILAAGTASAGRQANVREQEQAYYTVTSAAQFVRDQIEGQEFEYFTRTTTPQGGPSKTETKFAIEPKGDLKDLLKTAGVYIFENSENIEDEPAYTDEIKITPTNQTLYPELSEVIGTITVDKGTYNIEIKLKISDTAEDAGLYTCTITIPTISHKVRERIDGVEGTSTWVDIRTKVQWGEATITKG